MSARVPRMGLYLGSLVAATVALVLVVKPWTRGSDWEGPRSARNDEALPAAWFLHPEQHLEELSAALIGLARNAPEAAQLLIEASRKTSSETVVAVLIEALGEDDRSSVPRLHEATEAYVAFCLLYHDELSEDLKARCARYKAEAKTDPHRRVAGLLGSWPAPSDEPAKLVSRVERESPKAIATLIREYATEGGPDVPRTLAALLRMWGNDASKAFHRQVLVEQIFGALRYPDAAALVELLITNALPDDTPLVMPPLANQIGLAMGPHIRESNDFVVAAGRAEASSSSVVRLTFVVGLGSTAPGSRIAEVTLRRLALGDPSPTVRHAALVNLARVAAPEAVLPVAETLLVYPRDDDQLRESQTVLGALRNLTITSPQSVGEVRRVIAGILDWPPSPRADRVKRFALTQFDAAVFRGLTETLERLTQDPNEYVAAAAAAILKRDREED